MIDRLREGGGAEQLQITFAGAVASKGVELSFVTLRPSEEAAKRTVEALGVTTVVTSTVSEWLSRVGTSRN